MNLPDGMLEELNRRMKEYPQAEGKHIKVMLDDLQQIHSIHLGTIDAAFSSRSALMTLGAKLAKGVENDDVISMVKDLTDVMRVEGSDDQEIFKLQWARMLAASLMYDSLLVPENNSNRFSRPLGMWLTALVAITEKLKDKGEPPNGPFVNKGVTDYGGFKLGTFCKQHTQKVYRTLS